MSGRKYKDPERVVQLVRDEIESRLDKETTKRFTFDVGVQAYRCMETGSFDECVYIAIFRESLNQIMVEGLPANALPYEREKVGVTILNMARESEFDKADDDELTKTISAACYKHSVTISTQTCTTITPFIVKDVETEKYLVNCPICQATTAADKTTYDYTHGYWSAFKCTARIFSESQAWAVKEMLQRREPERKVKIASIGFVETITQKYEWDAEHDHLPAKERWSKTGDPLYDHFCTEDEDDAYVDDDDE
jgi:uncharacterized protein (UPF0212 family)